jgi:MFS family permease
MVSIAPSAGTAGGRETAWWMVAVLFSIYVLSWLDRLIISMLVEPIKASMALSDFQMSLILGPAFAVCYAIFGLPLGWAADRFSRRWVIFVWTLATSACAYATSFEGLLVSRIFVGIGEAALLPSAYSLIADGFAPNKLTLATSTFQMAGKVGSATAFGLGGIAIGFANRHEGAWLPFHGPAEPWQLVMLMVGFPGVLIGLLVFSFRDPGRRTIPGVQADGSVRAGVAFMRTHWRLMGWMMVAFSALGLVGYSMTSWVPTFMGRRYGWEPTVYGPWLSAMNLVAAVSLVINGRIVDLLFSRGMKDAHLRFYSWLIAGIAPVILYMFFAGNPWVFLASYGVVQFITVPYMVYLSAVVALLAPSAVRGQIIGIFMFVLTLLGMGAGPSLVGALTNFVFRSEAEIGKSLAVVVIGGSLIAFAALRASLKHLGPAVQARGVH